jgi:hypothetical protein
VDIFSLSQVDETDPSKVLKVVHVRFTIKPEGDSPSIVVLRVKNTGVLPLDYLLKYPRDDEDEPENWVDKDLQGIDEQTLNLILENKLFICEPRRGHLQVMTIPSCPKPYDLGPAECRLVLPTNSALLLAFGIRRQTLYRVLGTPSNMYMPCRRHSSCTLNSGIRFAF